MKRKNKRLWSTLLATFIIVVGLGYVVAVKVFKNQKEVVPAAEDINQFIAQQKTTDVITDLKATAEEKPLPAEINLKVPFYPQAPFGNWAMPWQEACEEASVLLVANAYYEHNWSRDEFNTQILTLVDWENQTFGDYKHTDVAQTAEMLNDYLHLRTIIHENPTVDDVKKVLAQGHLIVMTFAGKHLANPNYKNGGPNYHAMVIKGYRKDGKIITDDVGTRNGEDYVYTWDTLQNSLHDYAEPIENGAKKMIEVLPPESLPSTTPNAQK